MNIHYLQHVFFETPGYILDWAKENNHSLSATHFYQDDYQLPDVDSFDLLVVMGGPMNIYEEEKYPYLVEEKLLIKESIEKDKMVLGICLGAQLIADVIGGKVVKNETKEIGWLPVHSFNTDFFPLEFTPLHWHGDTFTITKDCELIASSKDCKNQAFIYKEKVIGLQFHLESTEETLAAIIENCEEELSHSGNIMSKEEMLNMSSKCIPSSNKIMKNVLENLVMQ